MNLNLKIKMKWTFMLSLLFSISSNVDAPGAAPMKLSLEPPQTKNRSVIVAVIDTGADLSHDQIKDHLWTNPGEAGLDQYGRDKSSNGVDDDENGFVDDVHGWNFVSNSKNLSDHHGHGTHIAGIISEGKNTDIKLMILKYFENGTMENLTIEASNRAVSYAIKMGAHIINYSGGGDIPSSKERALFEQADSKGIFTVAASGNDGRSNDFNGFFPASYDLNNMISVASTDQNGKLLPSSNRGIHSVDLAALGSEVLSALPSHRMGRLTGTSQATAKVTAILAELMVQNPNISNQELKDRLIATSQVSSSLYGSLKNPRIPNLKRAMHMRAENDFDEKRRIALKKAQEVFDDPLLNEGFDRHISSD